MSTSVTFAEAAAEYLRFAEQDRGCKPSTVRGYRNAIKVHLLPVFGEMKLEDITVQEIERWRAGMSSVRVQRELSNKTKNNLLVLMHAIFRHAVKLYGLPANPVASVDRFRVRSSGDIQVFSPEEVWALVRAAGSEADAAIFLTAAFTGLRRGELLGLRWRDVDFAGSTIRVRASYAAGKLTTPKSGKVRAVPMAPDVASALAKLGDRERYTGDDDFVFAGEAGPAARRRRAQQPVPRCAGEGRATTLAVPRPEAHVRHADDRQGRHPPSPGVDGARRHPDHDEVPALRAAGRGRGAGRSGLSAGAARSQRTQLARSSRRSSGERAARVPVRWVVRVCSVALRDLTDRSAVLDAINEFREIGEEAFLEKYGFERSRRIQIAYEGETFPSKAILGAAHGFQFPDAGPLRPSEFSGGRVTVDKARQLGFEVVEADAPDDLALGLHRFMELFAEARTTKFGHAHPAVDALRGCANVIEELLPESLAGAKVRPSVGQGNWAGVPWIAVLHPRETTTTQRGVYPVLLFREDLSAVEVTIAQGVTELNQTLGRRRCVRGT